MKLVVKWKDGNEIVYESLEDFIGIEGYIQAPCIEKAFFITGEKPTNLVAQLKNHRKNAEINELMEQRETLEKGIEDIDAKLLGLM
jgi:hypothetical protein